MVIDSSVVSALPFREEGAERFGSALSGGDRKFMSAFNRLAAAIVVEAGKGEPGAKAPAELLAVSVVEMVPFDAGQAKIRY